MATYDPAMFGFDPNTGISRPKSRMDAFAQMLMANPAAYKQIREMMSRDAEQREPEEPGPTLQDTSSGIGLPFSQFMSPRTAEASPAAPPAPLAPPIPSREARVLGLLEGQNREGDIAAREQRRAEAGPFNPFGGLQSPNDHMAAPPTSPDAPSLEITPDTLDDITQPLAPFLPQKLWGVIDDLRTLDRTMSPGNQPSPAKGGEAPPDPAAPDPVTSSGTITPPEEAVRPKPRPEGLAPDATGVPMPSTATRSTGSSGNPKGLAEDAVEAEEKLNRVQEFFKNRFGVEDPDSRQALALALMQGGAAMMQAPGNFLEGLGAGVQAGVGGYTEEIERDRKADLEREVMDLKREEAAANRANDALRAEAARVALQRARIELELAKQPPSAFDNLQSGAGKAYADAMILQRQFPDATLEEIEEMLGRFGQIGKSANPLAELGL